MSLPASPPLPDPALASALLQQAPSALLHVDAQGRLLWANAAALRLCPSLSARTGGAGTPLHSLFLMEQPLPDSNAAWVDGAAPELELRQATPTAKWVRARGQALPAGELLLELRPCDEERTLRQRLASGLVAHSDGLGAQMALSIDLGQIAFWRHEFATNRMHYNDQAFEVLDIPPRPGGLSLDEVRSFIHPDDLPQVVASAEQALATGLPVDMDARYRRSDGSWRTVMTRRVLQRDAQGRAVAFVGLALDVTDRVEAQRQTDELAQRFELVTRIAGIGYWSKTLRAERATWSDALRQLFGLTDDEPVPLLTDWLVRHVHPDDRERVTDAFKDWIRSGTEYVSSEFRVLRADGEVRQVLSRSRLESPGKDPLLFGVVIDVTESRSAAQALRDATERVALAARGAGLATWELDMDTGAAFWDAQMWRLRGLTEGSATPDLDGRLLTTHPDDRALVSQVNQRGLEEEGQIESAFRVVWPDGEVRWLASRSAVVRDEATGKLRRIGVNWDITDRRTAEVVRQERELAQRESAAKSQFLARMSHELRTPLNAVLGFTQLLQADAPRWAEGDAPHGQWLEHIQSAGQHLLSLINGVLELSSAEGSTVPLTLQPVRLDTAVAEVMALLQPLQDGHGVRIEVDDLQPVVMAEGTRLRQVLLNLMSNAIKYNLAGGQVWLRAQTQGEQVLVSVEDNGRGMNEEQMAHLFEPFNRLGAEALGVEGTGIGLAIVKSLVERMNGQVSASSMAGQGTCFELRLQAAQPGAVEAEPPQAETGHLLALPRRLPGPLKSSRHADLTPGTGQGPGQGMHTHRLLYIEDNPVNALIISELVARRPDLQLHLAGDGLSGVDMARQLQPELVLLDMQLPDIDGHEVLRRLRSLPATADIPCIALSANAMPEDIALALDAGMLDYWTKPLDFSVFMAALDRLFGPAP
jgi:PAS domain S-box-containing protein